ncbi:MAG: DMT family transporter [Bacteroidota bacterium]
MKPSLLKWIFLVLLALIWGSSFILMKRGLMYFRPDQVAAMRMLIAFIVSFPFVARHYKKIGKGKFKYIAVVGILGSGIPAILFTTAQTRINSSLAGMLNSLTPLFTLLIGFWFFRTRFSVWQIAGVAAGFAGAAGLILINAEGDLSADAGYALLIMIATLFYGISVNTIKAHLAGINVLIISGFALLCVGIPYGIYLFTTDFVDRLANEPNAWTGVMFIAILAVMGTALSNILYFQMVKISSPLFASAVTYFIPIVALFWGLGDGESLNLLHIPAMLAILGGVAMISYDGYKTRKMAELNTTEQE